MTAMTFSVIDFSGNRLVNDPTHTVLDVSASGGGSTDGTYTFTNLDVFFSTVRSCEVISSSVLCITKWNGGTPAAGKALFLTGSLVGAGATATDIPCWLRFTGTILSTYTGSAAGSGGTGAG